MNYTPKKVAKWLFGGKGQVAPHTLQKLNIVTAAALTLQAIALLVFGVAYSVPVYIAHVTGDALQTKLRGTEVTAPALHELWRINLAYAAVAALLITAVVYALIATVWRAKYESWLKKEVQPLRWVAIAVAGGLLLVILGLAAGISELTDLKSIFAFAVLAGLSAAWLELHPVRRGKLDIATWLGVVIALVSALMPWLIILGTLLATNVFGSVSVPGYVWLLYATLGVGTLLFVATMHLSNFKQGRWASYSNAEAQYTGLVLAVETVFVWVLFAAVLHP
jgi:hypothetical protein